MLKIFSFEREITSTSWTFSAWRRQGEAVEDQRPLWHGLHERPQLGRQGAAEGPEEHREAGVAQETGRGRQGLEDGQGAAHEGAVVAQQAVAGGRHEPPRGGRGAGAQERQGGHPGRAASERVAEGLGIGHHEAAGLGWS